MTGVEGVCARLGDVLRVHLSAQRKRFLWTIDVHSSA